VLLPFAVGLAFPAIRVSVMAIFVPSAVSGMVPAQPAEQLQAGALAAGAIGGLLIGIVLVALLEYRNSRVVTEHDVLHAMSLPVLGVIPVMTSARERQHDSRRRVMMDVVGSLVLVAAVLLVTSSLLL
jgi:hypothetical protein